MKYFIGLDNGGTTTKAAIYDEKGKEITVASMDTAMISKQADFVERDMDEMWDANCTVVRKAMKQSGIDPKDIACVAITGHGKGLYLWGKDDRPVCNGIISTDNRAWRYPQMWQEDGTADKLYELTCQNILACQPVSLLRWFKDHQSDVFEKIKYVFEAKDYVRYRMTGVAATDITDISGTNFVNLHTRNYDDEILKLLGLEEVKDKLVPIMDSVAIAGYVTEEAAQKCGLLPGTPVAGGMWDCDACMLSTGVVNGERLSVIAGTWNINLYLNPHPVTDHTIMMNSCFILPGYYVIEESSPTSAGANAWYIRTLLPELKKAQEESGSSIYDIMNGWVEEIDPKEFCPVFLPYVIGSNVHPNAKGCFIGMNTSHTRAHISRGVYEGIVFTHKTHLSNLLKDFPGEPAAIRLAGGIGHSRVWSQMFADVLGYPVEIVDVNETGTLGCAIGAAVAAGVYSDVSEAAREMVRVRETFMPRPEYKEIYDRKYALYLKAVNALDCIWDDYQAYLDDSVK